MTGTEKFWVAFNSLVAAVLIALIFSLTTYWTDHNTKIVELIEKGVDPVAVMCAMQDDYGTYPTCIILATKK